MKGYEFKHFGVPTDVRHENERYMEKARLYLTDPNDNPFRIEFLRFEPDSPMPDAIKSLPHAAYEVEDLDKALTGYEVILPPFETSPGRRVAFIAVEDALVELMESK